MSTSLVTFSPHHLIEIATEFLTSVFSSQLLSLQTLSEFWVSWRRTNKPTKHARLYSDKWRKSAYVLLPAAHECFGEWIIPSFQQMFYGVCRVSAHDCQGASSFCIFRKCEYEASPEKRRRNLQRFHSMPSFGGNFISARRVWREAAEMHPSQEGKYIYFESRVCMCTSVSISSRRVGRAGWLVSSCLLPNSKNRIGGKNWMIKCRRGNLLG